jgi:hypothetical protein
MNTYSILKNVNSTCVEAFPFPHIVIEDALPKDFAASLTSTFPLGSLDLKQNNTRIDISIAEHKRHNHIPDMWKEFMLYHSSQEFLDEVLDVFQDYIKKDSYIYKLINSGNIKAGRRKIDTFEVSDILLDAQISINTPVTKKSSVRKIHTDDSKKIFSGLIYLRQPYDDSHGGHLNLYSWKPDYSELEKVKFYKEGTEEDHVELWKTIDYKNNTAILFLNSIDALHGVSPRDKTSHPRTFINLIAECPVELYEKYPWFKKKFLLIKEQLVKLKKSFLY